MPLPLLIFVTNTATLLIAALAALLLHSVLVLLATKFLKRHHHPFIESTLALTAPPARYVALTAALWIALSFTTLPAVIDDGLRHILAIALIITLAWLSAALLRVGRDVILRHYELTSPDNLNARRVHTQLKLLERVVVALLVLIALGCVLMTFDKVRQLGMSLLASAGIVGVILGFAAQKVLGSLFAGLQVAITEPIRIDDVVIVEGEWGTIEEITLTYVVVRIWDLRRLVVPMTYFLEKPFQNWTRTSADLLGAVFLYVDPTVRVEPLRVEFRRLLEGSALWDKKVCVLQVTDAREHCVEIRALLSTANASDAFTLRCVVRERLLEFLTRTQPGALVKVRNEVERFGVGRGLGGGAGD